MAIRIESIAGEKKQAVRNPWAFLNADLNFQSSENIGDAAKEMLYRELQALFEADIDMGTSLGILCELLTDKKSVRQLERVRLSIEKGVALSDAMQSSATFSTYEVSVVRIGEEGGELSRVFTQLAEHYGDKMKLKRTIRQAMAYPVFVFVISTLVIAFMMQVVVPMFADVFARSGAELPALTQFVMDVSTHFRFGFLIFILLTGLGVPGFRLLLKNDAIHQRLEQLAYRIPFFGEIRRKTLLARICQSLDLLLSSGAQLDRALNMTKDMSGSLTLRNALVHVNTELLKGRDLESSLSDHKIFDKGFVAKVAVAERVNRLDKTFASMAKQYTREVEHKTAMMGSIIEPVTILFISIFVGIVLVAMYLPMFKLSTSF